MQFETWLRRGLIGGIFLVLAIPFFIADPLFFPFITGKNFAFRILVELLLAGWIILAILNPIYRPRKTLLLPAVAAFVGVLFFSDIFADNATKAIWSNFERMEGWITLIHLFAYFLVTSAVLNVEKLWDRFFNTSIGASAVMGIYGLFQLAGFIAIRQGGGRVDGTFGNATYLAAYMLFNIFLTLWMLWRHYLRAGSSFGYVLYSGALALQVVILYFTATRGAILGVIGGVLLTALLIAFTYSDGKAVRRWAFGIVAGVALLVGGFAAIQNTTFVQESPVLARFADISFESQTVRSRLMVWGMAWEGFKEKPLLGWGQENFNLVFNKYYNPNMFDQEPWFDRAHSVIFDWLVAGGAFGLIAYLSIPLLALFYIWRPRSGFDRVEQSVLTGMLAAYGFHSLFVFDNIGSYIIFFAIIAYLHFRNAEMPLLPETMPFSTKTVKTIVAPAMLVVVLGTVYFVNVTSIRAAATLIDAMSAGGQQQFETALDTYDAALAINAPIGTQEIRERLAEQAVNMPRTNASNEIKQEYFSRTEEEIATHIENVVSNDARLWLFLGSLYANYGLTQEALNAYNQALSYSPTKQQILMQVGFLHISQDEYEEALPVLQKAHELAPQFPEPRVAYAAGAVYAGDMDLARSLLEPEFGTMAVDNPRLLRAYYDAGEWALVIGIWENRAEASPNDPQIQFSLAAAYYEAGRTQAAITKLQEVADTFPQATDQAEYYIEEIRAGRRP